MHTSVSRGIRIALAIAVLLLAFACAAAPTKSIPADEANPRLQTVLQELARTAQARPASLPESARNRGIPLQADKVTVIVEPASGRVSSISQAAIAAIGGKVEARSRQLMRVQIPVDRLESLADEVSGIAFIRLPYRPRELAVTSEGVALTGADDFHTAGYYGQGTKVAIIDLGFNGLTAAKNAGELDNVVYTYDYTGTGLETGTEHGTGVAEIVADMAPQASLYLLKIGDSVDLQNAVNYCITNGINVINHSVGWYNTNFYDGTGMVVGIANDARDNGILWVNAAGNEASDGHWQGAFVDSDGDGYLDFGSGTDYLDSDSIDEGNRIYLASGDTVNIYMTWDDWTTSDQDYDLYLYDSFGNIVTSSTGNQTGTQQPIEEISYTVTSAGYYEIVIYDYSAPNHPNIEFFAFIASGSDVNLEYHHPESTIIAPANSAKVLAVGAIRQSNWTTGPQEYFSSQGPSNASKYATSIIKPDICGPDGVSNYTYSSDFYGTSAASPHVAGAAALLLSEDPTLTVDQLQAKLESDAIDMGAAGKDNLYGSGRLNLVLTSTQDLVGYWKFNEGSGSVAGDSSGLGNDGAIHGASWVSGSPDGSTALSFNGSSDYVQVPYTGSLNPSNALTIEAWIRPGALPSGQSVIVEKPYTSHVYPYYQYSLVTLYSGIKFMVAINGSIKSVGNLSAGLTVGNWYHVAGEYDGQYLKIYVNGVLKGSADVSAGTISGYSTDLYMGRHGNVTSEKFKGMIDEVRIHNRALDPSEFNLLPTGATPPALVSDFNASDGENAQSTLTWTNPGDTDLAEVLVKRNTGSYPADHTAGTTVYDNTSPTTGASVTYTDTGLTNGTTYYYAVFSKDTDNKWNDTVQAGSNADTGTPSTAAGPVGYWRFNEGSGSVAGDSSGLGNDGAIHGASWVSGSPDGSTALSFNGSSDYVQVPYTGSLNPSNALTIEAWIRPGALPSGQSVIVEKPYTSHVYPYYQYSLVTLYSGIKFMVAINGSIKSVGNLSAGLTVGNWYHVAGEYDGQYLKIYVNGVLKGSADVGAGTISGYSTDLYMGRHGNVTSEKFKGMIDEVRIHNRALDPSEFNLLPAGYHPSALAPEDILSGPLCRPNPVRSAPVSFVVESAEVAQISVSIYDLSGTRVYESGWKTGNTIEWQLQNGRGELLANGVYLYVVQVKTQNGVEERSTVQALAILR